MQALIARHITAYAKEALVAFPALVIQGARQVGKSTLAQHLADSTRARVLTLDDAAFLAAAIEDPKTFVDQARDGTLVIDEIQRAPQLLLAIKASIDRDRRPGRFVLTGSSDLLRLGSTPDSLAGRAVTVPLRGFSRGELAGRFDDFATRFRDGIDLAGFRTATARSDYVAAVAAGGYPDVQGLSPRLRAIWLDGYAERIVRRDAAEIARLSDPGRLTAVLRLLAANQAGELVKARVASDAGVPATSVTSYLDILETLYLTERLRPWTPNLTSREAAKPKVSVTDSALAMRLSRLTEEQLLPPTGSGHLGPLIEGFVIGELLKQRTWSDSEFELFHYRTRDGLEVDLIVEFPDGRILGIEVKSGSTLRADHFNGLRALRDRLGERFLGGIVMNTASEGQIFGDRLWSLPIAALWEV